MISHPSGPDNPDLPKPTAVELLAESPWAESDLAAHPYCRWCNVWKGSEHDHDCPWHVRLMTAKDNKPGGRGAPFATDPESRSPQGWEPIDHEAADEDMPTLLVNKDSSGLTIQELKAKLSGEDAPHPVPQEAQRLWVIGADSGLGRHITAMATEDDGRDVVATGVSQCDVRDPWEIYNAAQRGPFDAVVYCAGVNHLAWSKDINEEDLLQTFDVNVAGFIRVIRALAQRQADHPTSIVAISSDAAEVPMRASMAYCASKAALSMAVRVAAREHAPHWRVNAIQPAAIEGTEMSKYVDQTVPELRNWSPNEARDRELSSAPMGRRATMGEVAALTLSVLDGPEFMSGSLVNITGGK